MVVLSPEAANAMLDAYYGAERSAAAPASHELALFSGDPRDGGVELTGAGGYERAAVQNSAASWPAAVDGTKTSKPVVFADSTGPWSHEATWWVLYASGVMCDGAALADPLLIVTAGPGPAVTLAVSYVQEVL